MEAASLGRKIAPTTERIAFLPLKKEQPNQGGSAGPYSLILTVPRRWRRPRSRLEGDRIARMREGARSWLFGPTSIATDAWSLRSEEALFSAGFKLEVACRGKQLARQTHRVDQPPLVT